MKTSLSSLIVVSLFLAVSAAAAEDKTPTPFAYAAPAFIKELDTRFPAQPPVPPSPPRYGGVLHFPATVRAFDPTAGYRPELALVWDTLTEWEATWYFPEVQRTPVIRKTLATSWEMVTPSTWIFKLRQGVKFHNRPPVNGREMTAEDVKYSYELLKDKAQYSTRAALVKKITVVDRYTVKFELSMADPKFYLNVVDSLSPVIVPREAVEAPGGLAENPIGTGAFMLKEFSPGEGALHQARGLLLRQPRPQLSVQPEGGQAAPGRGRLSQRLRDGAGMGRVPGLGFQRVRAAHRALLRRHRRAREAPPARDVDVAVEGRRRPALQPDAGRSEP